jgi:hypothetical protein
MTPLQDMSIPELLHALCQVEEAIGLVRLPGPPSVASDDASAWDDIGALAADEQRIVAEFRRWGRLESTLGVVAGV